MISNKTRINFSCMIYTSSSALQSSKSPFCNYHFTGSLSRRERKKTTMFKCNCLSTEVGVNLEKCALSRVNDTFSLAALIRRKRNRKTSLLIVQNKVWSDRFSNSVNYRTVTSDLKMSNFYFIHACLHIHISAMHVQYLSAYHFHYLRSVG